MGEALQSVMKPIQRTPQEDKLPRQRLSQPPMKEVESRAAEGEQATLQDVVVIVRSTT